MEEMEKRSDRHIRDLVAHTAFKGLDANEIGCARISVMAGGNCSLKGPNTDEQDQLSPDRHIRLATHGRSIQMCQEATYASQHMSAYSITSSARRRIDVGNATPIALAVFKLSASSKFVICSNGSSAGCAPLRIFAT
jgi:hypothetical protein